MFAAVQKRHLPRVRAKEPPRYCGMAWVLESGTEVTGSSPHPGIRRGLASNLHRLGLDDKQSRSCVNESASFKRGKRFGDSEDSAKTARSCQRNAPYEGQYPMNGTRSVQDLGDPIGWQVDLRDRTRVARQAAQLPHRPPSPA